MRQNYPDFESFLMDKYAEKVNCTEDDTLDEEVWLEKFNDWQCNLDCERWIYYANMYGNKMVEIAIDNLSQSLKENI